MKYSLFVKSDDLDERVNWLKGHITRFNRCILQKDWNESSSVPACSAETPSSATDCFRRQYALPAESGRRQMTYLIPHYRKRAGLRCQKSAETRRCNHLAPPAGESRTGFPCCGLGVGEEEVVRDAAGLSRHTGFPHLQGQGFRGCPEKEHIKFIILCWKCTANNQYRKLNCRYTVRNLWDKVLKEKLDW